MTPRAPFTHAAVLVVAFICVIELVFVSQTEPLTGMPLLQTTVDDATLVAKRRLIPRAAGRVLLVGDSSCMMDLDPRVFDRVGLQQPVNIGTLLSLTFPGFAVLTGEALNAPRPPTSIVVAALPRSFETTEKEARAFDFVGRYLVAYGLESPVYHRRLADHWSWFFRKHRVNIYPPEFGGSFVGYQQILDESNGHFPELGKYHHSDSDYRRHFNPSDYSTLGFLQLLEAAHARDVSVVLWWSPSPDDAVAPEYLAEADRFIGTLRERHPELTVPHPPQAWSHELFGSVTHLSPQGAAIHSTELAEYFLSTKGRPE